MNSGRMTVILLAVTIALALAVPSLREALSERAMQARSTAQGMYPSPSQLAEIVAEAPRDARLHYAYALALSAEMQSPGRLGPPEESVTAPAVRDAFRDAIALAPDNPAPRLSLAIFEIDQANITRLPGEPSAGDEAYMKPTLEQLERVRRARELLDEVQDLDPNNALADYLLAWTWLAEGDAEVALAQATLGATRTAWTTYERQRAEAVLALVDRMPRQDAFAPMAAIAINADPPHRTASQLRSLVRALRTMADGLRERDQHDGAMRTYEALLQMGHLMRTEAHSLMDGLLAVAMSAIAVSSDDWAPPNEAELLEADEDLQRTDLRLPRFAAYLREHERKDLAVFAEEEIEAGKRFKERSRDLPDRMMNELVQDISGGPVMNAMAVWLTTALMLGVAALIGLLSLIAHYWREPRTRVGWSHRQWLGLLALTVLPGQALAWFAVRRFESLGAEAGSTTASIVMGGVALSIVLWAIGVLVLALRKRRSLPSEERLGGPRTFLRGLRALILPTLAALVLLCMPATLAIEHNLNAMAAKHRQLAIEGEVEYYGLQTDLQAVQSDTPDMDRE